MRCIKLFLTKVKKILKQIFLKIQCQKYSFDSYLDMLGEYTDEIIRKQGSEKKQFVGGTVKFVTTNNLNHFLVTV